MTNRQLRLTCLQGIVEPQHIRQNKKTLKNNWNDCQCIEYKNMKFSKTNTLIK